jgi:hypothetical protein
VQCIAAVCVLDGALLLYTSARNDGRITNGCSVGGVSGACLQTLRDTYVADGITWGCATGMHNTTPCSPADQELCLPVIQKQHNHAHHVAKEDRGLPRRVDDQGPAPICLQAPPHVPHQHLVQLLAGKSSEIFQHACCLSNICNHHRPSWWCQSCVVVCDPYLEGCGLCSAHRLPDWSGRSWHEGAMLPPAPMHRTMIHSAWMQVRTWHPYMA